MIAAIYARKSTESEKNPSGQSDSVELQISNARAFAAARGWEVAEVFADDGFSGAAYTMLKARQQMIEGAAEGRFQALVISEQSRLGRNMIESAYQIMTIAESGVEIWTYLDGQRISVDDEVGQAHVFLKGFAGSAERSAASKRTRSKAQDLAKGGFVTGGRVYGYDISGEKKQKTRKVNEEQAATVLRVFTLYADGLGHKAIRDALNKEGVKGPSRIWKAKEQDKEEHGRKWTPPKPGLWTCTALRDLLANEVYRGTIVWGKFRVMVKKGKPVNVSVPESEWLRREAPEVRIVPEDLWLRAAARRDARRQTTPRGRGGRLMGRTSQADVTSGHLLSGLMVCSVCGGSVRVHTEVRGGKNARWYTCANRRTRGAAACSNDVKVRQAQMENAVLAAVRARLTPDEVAPWLEAALKVHRDRWGQRDALKARIERDLGDVARRIGHLVEAIAKGDTPEPVIAALKGEQARKQALETEQATISTGKSGWLPTLLTLDRPGEQIIPPLDQQEAYYRKAVTDRITDVWVLLDGTKGPTARAMLRKVLAGSIGCTPVPGGYRFEAPLALDRLISGTSRVGETRRGRSTCRGRDGSPGG